MIHVDQLMEQCIKREATEIRLSPGKRPQLFVRDTFVSVGLRPLADEDMHRFMRSITPDAKQREIKSDGQASFDLQFGAAARFHVRVRGANPVAEILLRPI